MFFFFLNFTGLKILLFIILMGCIASDIGGYLFGKYLKGPKLTKISPKKTYSGAFGSIFLGASTCIAIIFFGLDGKRSIINSPILNFEVTQTGTVGMFIKYQMAGFLAIFAITMLIQFISYYFKSIADYRNEPIISDNNENS